MNFLTLAEGTCALEILFRNLLTKCWKNPDILSQFSQYWLVSNQCNVCAGDERAFTAPTLPFQIPFGAQIPVECDNLIAASKNICNTHLANSAQRLYPEEWSIGETAGELAVYCCQNSCSPQVEWGEWEKLKTFPVYPAKRQGTA